MVVVFGCTSDQKAIGIAKDHLKAHLLAVRLYQDQISGGDGGVRAHHSAERDATLRLAFMPLLFVIIPITLLIVQWTGIWA